MFTRAGGTDVSLRDVTIAQMANGDRECGWRHALEARGGFRGFWKSQRVLPQEKTVGSLLLAEARLVALWRVPYVLGGGADGKVIIERLRISLPYVFSCFGIPMFYVYIYIYEHYERFAYRYEYVHFTYSYLAMLHIYIYIYIYNLYIYIYIYIYIGEGANSLHKTSF